MDNLDCYSVALWHLKDSVSLAYLSHQLMDYNRHHPVSWFALANCFTLKQEHSVAIRCLLRATNIDPHYAYAFILLGYEYMSNEELDKSQSAFRQALSLDSRNYKAWYVV